VTLDEAVSNYVSFRRSEGADGSGAESILRTLCRQVGEADLSSITANQISEFIHNPRTASVTRITRFSVVRRFFDHYFIRQQVPSLVLEKPPRTIVPRCPLIFSRSQIRSLLQATNSCANKRVGVDRATFRIILLVLYATGMTIQEALTLRESGVDLKRKKLRLEGTCSRPARDLPIGLELCKELKAYKESRKGRRRHATLFFHQLEGQPIRASRLRDRFEFLCRSAQIGKSPQGHLPRLTDLRLTFAVHRITSWVKQGINLNSLLPALSTYMGYANLTKAEQFLSYVPDRFRDDLRKLSPMTRSKHWRNESELMTFLLSL